LSANSLDRHLSGLKASLDALIIRYQAGPTRKPARGKWTTISPARSSRRRMAICRAESETISPLTAILR
jgi:hypothetical protein